LAREIRLPNFFDLIRRTRGIFSDVPTRQQLVRALGHRAFHSFALPETVDIASHMTATAISFCAERVPCSAKRCSAGADKKSPLSFELGDSIGRRWQLP
jgi:hypothetical protein